MKLDTGEIRQYFCSSKIRFLHIRHFLHHQTTTNNFAHAQTLSRMSSVRSYFLRSCLFTYDIMKNCNYNIFLWFIKSKFRSYIGKHFFY
jgi:hypothetical protein